MAHSVKRVSGNTPLPEDTREQSKARLELLYEVRKKIGDMHRMTKMLEQVIKMTKETMNDYEE